MAHSGGVDSTELAALIQALTTSMQQQAQAHAAATVPPKSSPKMVNAVIALAVAVSLAIPGIMMGYGQLQQRVLALESAHPEGLAAVAAELHSQTQRLDEIQRRLDSMMDRDLKR